MLEVSAFITMLLSSYLLVRAAKPVGIVEFVLVFFCLSTAHITVWGYLLSSVNYLGDVRCWSALGMITVLASAAIAILNRDTRQSILPHGSFKSWKHYFTSVKNWYIEETSNFEKLLLTPLILVTVSMGALNLAIIVSTAPHNWDSMTYHLARVAYYLQHNNLDYYPANYWAQVVHPKNSTLLLLYSYLISGRNENMTQLVQFVSYWVSICGVYGISIKIGNSRTQSIFAAMVSALLIEWLMESTTTQNDMILAAYFGTTIYFLFAFKETHQRKYLALAALGIGLSVGTKASSFLVLPSVAVVACYVLFQMDTLQKRLRNLAFFAACALLAIIVFALPAGYVENYRNFGNPMGPEQVRKEHSFEGKSIEYVARNGTKNVLRFGFEFLSVDGFPTIADVKKAQSLLRALPEGIVRSLGIDIETSEATIGPPFSSQKDPTTHEDTSYWGILGFALIWLVVLLSAIGVVKSCDTKVLSYAAILFLLAQAYAGPYDPYRGRYFIICAVFAVPTIGVSLQVKNKFIRAYLLLVVLIGCVSAISAVVLRPNSLPISISYQDKHWHSVFAMDRIEQLMRTGRQYEGAIKEFERLVPGNETVAVFLYEDSYEYPLFGKYLTRTIIPINPFDKGLQPVPANANYVLYIYTEGFPYASSNDIHLGADWYLRRLR